VPHKVKVLDVRRAPSLATGRIGQLDTLVTYQIDDGGAHSVSIPKDAPTAVEIEKAVKDDVASRSKFIGHTFEV